MITEILLVKAIRSPHRHAEIPIEMSSVTRALEKRRMEERRERIPRWRCGWCLFELPEHVPLIEGDIPFESEFIPSSPAGALTYHQVPSCAHSVQRGCSNCALLERILGPERSDTYPQSWSLGIVGVPFEFRQVRIFVQNRPSLPTYPFDFHPFVDCGNIPSGDTSSPKVFNMAMGWIQRCQKEHRSCTVVSEAKRMPSRILYIESLTPFHVRLIEDADRLPPQPYICLSHRWLSVTRESSLIKSRAEQFSQKIPEHTFYPLLKDAVEITERLGFRHLWIDCLCIYQDDRQDWHSQASEMATIYENAFLTISALSCGPGPSDEERIYANSPPRIFRGGPHDDCTVLFREFDTRFHPSSVTEKRLGTTTWVPSRLFPLASRGWAYQERFLSRRIIHFTKEEVIWECKEALWCECRLDEGLWELRKSMALRDSGIASVPWAEMVTDYSKTDLSFQSDRLPAISGIAKRYGEARGWTYLAGLWLEDLLGGLLWELLRESEIRLKPESRKLPSWSWASMDTSVRLPKPGDFRRPYFKLISHDITLGPNPFGDPEQVSLVLEGPYILTNMPYHSSLDRASKDVLLNCKSHPIWIKPDYINFRRGRSHIGCGIEVCLMFVAAAQYRESVHGLVLSCVDRLLERYERIGIFWMTFTEENEAIEAEFKTKRFTLV